MPDASIAQAKRPAVGGRGKPVPQLWRIGHDESLPQGDFVALVPGEEAPLLAITLPDTLTGSAREGVAFRQLRDRLGPAGEALDLRPARLKGHEQRWSAVLAAERSAVARWRAQAAGAKGRCRAILPDYLALPTAREMWTVQTEAADGTVMVRARLGPHDGFSAEAPLAAHMLASLIELARGQGALPRVVLRLGPAEPGLDAALQDLSVARSIEALPAGLEAPVILAHGESALDLGQDPRASADAMRARLVALRWPLALVFAGLLAWAVAIEAQIRRDLALAAAIDAATIEAVRRDFLPSGPLLDIPVQVTRELQRRRQPEVEAPEGPAPMDLLYQASVLVSEHPVRLQSLVMQPATGITLDLELDDFAALDRLITAMRERDLDARTMRSGTEPDGRVSATVLIEAER